MTSAANYALTTEQREQIAHDLTIAFDEGVAVSNDETLAALGMSLHGGWKVKLI